MSVLEEAAESESASQVDWTAEMPLEERPMDGGPGEGGTAARVPPASWGRRLVRGRPGDPRWVRPVLFALLAGTAILYLWDLSASGYGNSFYAAAVQAGSKSWKAFFFGSFDSSNFITVDKPPGSLWVMELSARMFGVNSWSLLVPQALEGVASVALLYVIVRRWFTPAAGLLAGAVLALTPVAALMFRFNNPDALLVLLMLGSVYAMVRAMEAGKTRWLVLAGTLVGFGFLTKMLQAFIILPILGLVYLLAGPPQLGKRIVQVLILGVSTVVAAGWWVAIVMLTPAADRPYVGGSTNNSLFNLIFGYNGVGRITGNETGSVGGGRIGGAGTGATSMWGPTGWNRLFLHEMGGQISWLIPGALIGMVGVLWLTRRAPRTDRTRAAVLLFGGALVLTGLVFSFAQGIIHPYYTIALAPFIGGLVGISAVVLWRQREVWVARVALAAGVAASAVWAYTLLGWSPTWLPVLRWVILIVGIASAVALLAGPRLRGVTGALVAAVALAGVLAGPVAYTLDTVTTPHTGAIPSAGPAVAGGGFGGGALPGGFPGRAGGAIGDFGGAPPAGGFTGAPPAGGFTGAPPVGGFGGGVRPPGGFGGVGGLPPGATTGGFGGSLGGGIARGRAGGGAAGGLLSSSTPSKALVAVLMKNAAHYTWVAATTGANSAAGYQLATSEPVMAIGGFNGTDPTPTLAAFQRYVSEGKVHWYIGAGSGGGGPGGMSSAESTAIATWVKAHYTATTIGGITLYDLSGPTH